MKKLPVVIIGTGTEARTAADIFHQMDIMVYGFLTVNTSDESQEKEINSIPVLGNMQQKECTKMLQTEQLDYIVALTDVALRAAAMKTLFELTKRLPVNAIHPTTYISPFANLASGIIAYPGCSICQNVQIDALTILHTHVAVNPDAVIGSNCVLGSGAVIGTGAKLGNGVFVSAGAVIQPGIVVEDNALIGPGAIVLRNVQEGKSVAGNPAVEIKV